MLVAGLYASRAYPDATTGAPVDMAARLSYGGAGDSGNASAPPLVIAVSTLAVAGLFNPLRKRTQHAVDRRFNRSAYKADTISQGFAAKLQGSLTIEEIASIWTEVVAEALQPKAAGIWLSQTHPTPPRKN